jgi:hypothetical protein
MPAPNNLEVEEQGLNLGNWLAASAILVLSGATSGVAVAQTGGPQITITPSAKQKVIAGSLNDLLVPFVCDHFSIRLIQAALAVEQSPFSRARAQLGTLIPSVKF